MDFYEMRDFGYAGELGVEGWLIARGYSIIPVFDAVRDGRGPRVRTPAGDLVAPDILAVRGNDVRWIEVKRKAAFSFHRHTGLWTTGIDLRSYLAYLEIARCTPWPVWLFSLHEHGETRDGPAPTGLYGRELSFLAQHEHHRGRIGKDTVVFWAHGDLLRLATLDELAAASAQAQQRASRTHRTEKSGDFEHARTHSVLAMPRSPRIAWLRL